MVGVAFPRFWNVQGSTNGSSFSPPLVLISHQWQTLDFGSPGIYLGPLKELKIGPDGTPRAMYWSGNEKLKGDPIALPPVPPPPPPAPAPPPEGRVDVASCGASGTTGWKVPAVDGAAGPIALNASVCLDVEEDNNALVLSPCDAAAHFVIQANGSIDSGRGCFVGPPATSYKYAPGNVFPSDPLHPHGLRLTDSPVQCCATCQALKNCSFWTYGAGGTTAKPTCYTFNGGCCYLKTAAAKGGASPTPGATSGTTELVPLCLDALPTLRMAACDDTATSQDWTTAGGSIKEAKSAGAAAPSPPPPGPGPALCVHAYVAPAPPPTTPPGPLFGVEVDLTVGVVIEAAMSCANASNSAGFWIPSSVPGPDYPDTLFLWNCAAQTFSLGGNPIDRQTGFAPGADVALKMLLVCPPHNARSLRLTFAVLSAAPTDTALRCLAAREPRQPEGHGRVLRERGHVPPLHLQLGQDLEVWRGRPRGKRGCDRCEGVEDDAPG